MVTARMVMIADGYEDCDCVGARCDPTQPAGELARLARDRTNGFNQTYCSFGVMDSSRWAGERIVGALSSVGCVQSF